MALKHGVLKRIAWRDWKSLKCAVTAECDISPGQTGCAEANEKAVAGNSAASVTECSGLPLR